MYGELYKSDYQEFSKQNSGIKAYSSAYLANISMPAQIIHHLHNNCQYCTKCEQYMKNFEVK